MPQCNMPLVGNEDNLPRYRLVVIGDGGVGKSAITIQYFQKLFVTNYDPTIEDSYIQHAVIDGELCVLDVMDTAGQEEYSAMREQYMRSGDGFLIVYSVTDTQSFAHVNDFFDQVLRVQDADSFPVLLVANKIDLQQSRKISEEKGKELASRLGIEYLETSAKEPPLNIDVAFQRIIRIIRNHPVTRGLQQRQRHHRQRHKSRNIPRCAIS